MQAPLLKSVNKAVLLDHPLCHRLARLPTPEEEARHNVKELWPEGVIVTADAATLHAASELPSSTGKCSLLEEVKTPQGLQLYCKEFDASAHLKASAYKFQLNGCRALSARICFGKEPSERYLLHVRPQVLDELKMAASSARRPGTVWMVTTSGLDLKELESMGSASHRILLKWQQTRRFQLIDPALATRDLILNAVRSSVLFDSQRQRLFLVVTTVYFQALSGTRVSALRPACPFIR